MCMGDMNPDTFMKLSYNGRHIADSSNDKTLSIEPQQDDAGMDNPTVLRVENQTGTKNADTEYA